MHINARGKIKNWHVLEVKKTLLVFSTPRVTDHTDFSFSRVEKNEVTAYASLWPGSGAPKNSQIPFNITSCQSNRLSVMCCGASMSLVPGTAARIGTRAHP